ncbi:MAG TPA: TIGR04551 family protein, partial [Myxococcaceae bacterium]|nr:TIGR04551 family protein [Myxococcaceae bacterium]
MVKALLAALSFSSAAAFAQSKAVPDGGTPAPAQATAQPAARTSEADELRREMDAKLEAAKKEIREEVRGQQAAQSAAQGWEEEVTEEKRKLELFVPNGYLRTRPELYYKFDLGRGQDTAGYWLYPHSPVSSGERTVAG